MKAKLFLDPGQTQEEAEETLNKAFTKRGECSDHERYSDPALNEFHAYICEEHSKVLKTVVEEVRNEIIKDASIKGL